jgi:hypothetical protein
MFGRLHMPSLDGATEWLNSEPLAIDYPVAVDNDYAIWNAFANHYWPALYFVDADACGTNRRPP